MHAVYQRLWLDSGLCVQSSQADKVVSTGKTEN